MSSTFGIYHIAYSGMYVNQSGLSAVTNDLANINTAGASRVRVSAQDQAVSAGGSSLGTGAGVADIARARAALLDTTYRYENAQSGYLNVKNGNLSYEQELLSEFDSDTSATSSGSATAGSDGLQTLLESFYSDWEELSKDPSSDSNRKAVVEAADSLLSTASALDSQLRQLQADSVNGVRDGVDTLNADAQQVADLNKQISVAEAGGGEPSYLLDQRDELLDQMSSLANIQVIQSDSSFQVAVDGMTLVNGNDAHKLTVQGDGSTAAPLVIQSVDYGVEVAQAGGSIQAYQEDADQSGYAAGGSSAFTAGASSSITNLRQALNDLVTTMATAINSLHSSGYGLDDTTGLDFFTAADAGQPLSLANIQVNPALAADPDKIAVAGKSSSADGGDNSGDNTVAEAIYNLSAENIFTFDGLPENTNDFYAATISWIGTAGSNAASSYNTQLTLAEQVDNQRQQISGISQDDEITKMIQYQQAYTANAKVLSTVDSLLGDLLSALG